MTIDELVRSELHAVAEQVDVPPMPLLKESRRSWRLVVAAAAAVALVIGGVTYLVRDRAEPPAHPIEKPKVDAREDHVDSSAPTIPWIDDGRLLVGGRRVPGRWVEVYSGGDTWLARRDDKRVFWGQGTEAHALGRTDFPLWYDGPYLSSGGRYVAAGISAATLVDTRTGRSRRVSFPGPEGESWLAGVTDGGVLLTGSDTVGSYAIRPGRPAVKLPARGGQVVRTNDSGLLMVDARGRVWVVDLAGTELRRVAQVLTPDATGNRTWGNEASLSIDRRWLLDLGWALDKDEPATLPVTAVEDGSPAPVRAPRGWVFAPQLAPGFWEPAGTLVTFVVRPDSRAYRAVRCAPATGECVLVEES
jgi:hypothetical protein